MEDFTNKIKETFLKHNVELTKEQISKFETYYTLLKEWNEKINLTTIIEMDDVIEKHFLDSVVANNLIKSGAKVIDIGSGAGFPGVPLKILRDDINIVLVDSVNKKVNFLNEVIKILGLKNISAVHSRIEDFANTEKCRENFDIVVSRAVSRLNVLCEYALPFLQINGQLIAYKSVDTSLEIDEAKNAIEVLGGKLEKVVNVPFDNMERNLIVIKKIKPTPKKYPRNGNKPRLNPII